MHGSVHGSVHGMVHGCMDGAGGGGTWNGDVGLGGLGVVLLVMVMVRRYLVWYHAVKWKILCTIRLKVVFSKF